MVVSYHCSCDNLALSSFSRFLNPLFLPVNHKQVLYTGTRFQIPLQFSGGFPSMSRGREVMWSVTLVRYRQTDRQTHTQTNRLVAYAWLIVTSSLLFSQCHTSCATLSPPPPPLFLFCLSLLVLSLSDSLPPVSPLYLLSPFPILPL